MSTSATASTHQPRAVIMLATHNGASWLPELLDSLLAQDYPKLLVLARDDHSADNTGDILASYVQAEPERLVIIENDDTDASSAGPKANFAALVTAALTTSSTADDSVYLFCDQDDIWHPDKIASLVQHMPQTDPGTPALCFSDMQVVNERGELLAGSFLDYQGLSRTTQLPRLLVQNHISGCAMMVNRAALQLATPLAEAALMHDWWLALLVAAAGDVSFCDEVLQDYRQHDANAVGASGYTMAYVVRRSLGADGNTLADLYLQAGAIGQRLADRRIEAPECLIEFAETQGMFMPRRIFRLWRGGFSKNGWIRKLALFFSPAAGRS